MNIRFPVDNKIKSRHTAIIWRAEPLLDDVRPLLSGKKRASAPEGHRGVGVQASTQGLQR